MIRRYLRRLLLVLAVAAAVAGVDHASKLAAAALHPAAYTKNDATHFVPWIPAALVLLAALARYRLLLVALGVGAGAMSSNMLDSYAWRGGVPNFIHVPGTAGTWNVADLCLWASVLAVTASLARHLPAARRAAPSAPPPPLPDTPSAPPSRSATRHAE